MQQHSGPDDILFTPRLTLVQHQCDSFKIQGLFLVKLLENMSHSVPSLRHAAARLQMEGQRQLLLETNKA